MSIETVGSLDLLPSRSPLPRYSSISRFVPWVGSAVGVCLVAEADALSRASRAGGELLFWLGLATILLPCVWRTVVSPGVSGDERLTLLIQFAVACYLTKVVYSPTTFVFHDEFAHLRTAEDIVATGHLFSKNPEIIVASHYPGLAALTAAVSQAAGISLTTAGLVVVGLARALLAAALFVLAKAVLNSSRAAAVVVLAYAANANFLYWEAQFAYESLSIPLAIAACALLANRRRLGTAATVLALVFSSAVVVTHHLTSYGLVLLLAAWWAVGRRRGAERLTYPPSWFVLGVALEVAMWGVCAAPETVSYLLPVLGRAVSQGMDLVTRGSTSRKVFANNGGAVQPLWEQLTAYAAVMVTLLLLVVAVHRRGRLGHPLARALLLGAVGWAVLQPLRLTAAGQETANRSGDYLYLGIGIATATALVLDKRRGDNLRVVAGGAVLSAMFAGGVAVSWSYSERLAPNPMASGVPAVTTPADRQAAEWLLATYGPGHRVATDVTTGLAFTAARQMTLAGATFGTHTWRIFAAATMNRSVYRDIELSRTEFIVVQNRLSAGLPPASGVPTFDAGEPAYLDDQPIQPANLEKFVGAPRLEEVYTSGPVSIFRVEVDNQ